MYAETAGTYNLDILYSNGWGQEGGQTLSVNEGNDLRVSYPPTFTWGDIAKKQIQVQLKQGMNTLQISNNGQNNVDIDAIVISTVS
ncbi:hypothetical protein D3C73_1530510 [compost metagenome]